MGTRERPRAPGGGWEVRWRDAAGRSRAKRFPSEDAARAYDAALSEVSPAGRRSDTARFGRSGGVYSEALALRVSDLEPEDTGGAIIVYRSRKGGTIGSTKSDRFRSVEIGPGLCAVLRGQLARRAELASGDLSRAVPFAMPVRTAKRDNGRWESAGAGLPFDRTTVSRDWPKHTLQDAALRDMPLHALRHTAAAAWLAAGNSLMYVQRQLGHADISTTERYYGHLERHVLAAGAVATEEAIARASAGARVPRSR